MTGDLSGRVVLVTGGGSGIGAETCRRFATRGAQVAVLDRHADRATAVAAEVDGRALTADVADAGAVDAAVALALAELGGLTDLVANAGVGRAKALWEYTDAEWALIVGVNLTGTFHCLRAVLPVLVAQGGGSVVNVASLTASVRRWARRPTRRPRPASSPSPSRRPWRPRPPCG